MTDHLTLGQFVVLREAAQLAVAILDGEEPNGYRRDQLRFLAGAERILDGRHIPDAALPIVKAISEARMKLEEESVRG